MSIATAVHAGDSRRYRRLAKVLYKRKGNIYVTIGDQIGPLFADVDFADLYAADGKPALSPNRLAMVVIFQFMEDLSDPRRLKP